MFDEFFRRRRNSGLMLCFMILLVLLGVGLFAAGFAYLF